MSPIEIGPDGAPIVTPTDSSSESIRSDESVKDFTVDSVEQDKRERSDETNALIPPGADNATTEHLESLDTNKDRDPNENPNPPGTGFVSSQADPQFGTPLIKESDLGTFNTNPPSTPPPQFLKEPDRSRKEQLLVDIGRAIKDHNGEGNIPITHPYWGWKNEYRSIGSV
jgi:hypothetical protein